MTPVGNRDKENLDKSWDHVPRANRGMVGMQARERDRGGRRKRLRMHSSHKKEQPSLRSGLWLPKLTPLGVEVLW
jgi:hypothetical protein